MVTSDFRPEVEIWPFRARAMHPVIIIEIVRSLWTLLWGRYHVPQKLFLVWTGTFLKAIVFTCRGKKLSGQVHASSLSLRWAFKKCWAWLACSDTKANSAFHPSGVGKWVPALAGKAKAGMAHSVSGWTRGVQVKLWDPLRTRAIPERRRSVFTTRRYTNPRLPLPLVYPLD